MNIEDVKVSYNPKDNLINKVEFILYNNKTITLTPTAECCSYSWIDLYNGQDFKYVLNKQITNIIMLKYTTDGEYNKNYLYQILFKKDKSFKFFIRNRSNGYYWGGISITNTYLFIEPKKYKPKSIIFIVGLPGSGKSTFIKNNFKNELYNIYDDRPIMHSLSNDSLANSIEFKNKFNIICNANFCSIDNYKNCIEYMAILNPEEAIITYLFDNDPEKSLINISNRGSFTKYFIHDINILTKIYNVNNNCYYNPIILNTY